MSSSRQRREQILAALFEKRHVTARDLAVELSVSEPTIRRDLKAMALVGDVDYLFQII